MENLFKWGAIVLVVMVAIRWFGGFRANLGGTLQSGMYSAPQWPYTQGGRVLMNPGLVGSVGYWQMNQPGEWYDSGSRGNWYGPQHGVRRSRRPRP